MGNQSPNTDMRKINRSAMLRHVAKHGHISRNKLCECMGLTGAGISRISRDLINTGMLLETAHESVSKGAGRRGSDLSLNPDGAYVLGITITANRKSVTLVNCTQQVLGQWDCDAMDVANPEKAIQSFCDVAHSLIEESGIDRNKLLGAGVGLATTEKFDENGYVTSPILGWNNVPVKSLFEAALGLPFIIEARALAMLRAEVWAEKVDNAEGTILINNGVGMGAAAYFDGRFIPTGGAGFGNVSHLSLPDSAALCRCGRTGCLEYSGTGAAVLADVNGWPPNKLPVFSELSGDLHNLVQQAENVDVKAQRAFRNAGRRMGAGIDAIVALLAPQRIILAGETGRQPDFIEGVRMALSERKTPLCESSLVVGQATSAQASSAIALDQFFLTSNLEQVYTG